MKSLLIPEDPLLVMTSSAIEVYPAEALGYLRIAERDGICELLSAHPIQRASRRKGSCREKRMSSKRLFESLMATSQAVAGYHSHPLPFSDNGREHNLDLSDSDMQYFKNLEDAYCMDGWLEVILSVRKEPIRASPIFYTEPEGHMVRQDVDSSRYEIAFRAHSYRQGESAEARLDLPVVMI